MYYSVVNGASLGLLSATAAIGIDTLPPIGGQVVDGGVGEDLVATMRKDSICVRWKGFADDASLSSASGIVYYEWRIVPANETVSAIEPLGAMDWVGVIPTTDTRTAMVECRDGLAMEDDKWYSVQVRAWDAARNSRVVSSDGFLVDSTPPEGGIVSPFCETDPTTVESTRSYIGTNFTCLSWHGFTDDASGIERYEYAIVAVSDNGTLAVEWTDAQKALSARTPNFMISGTDYVALVRAWNRAGLSHTAPSRLFSLDSTLPTIGEVRIVVENNFRDLELATAPTARDPSGFWDGYGAPDSMYVANSTLCVSFAAAEDYESGLASDGANETAPYTYTVVETTSPVPDKVFSPNTLSTATFAPIEQASTLHMTFANGTAARDVRLAERFLLCDVNDTRTANATYAVVIRVRSGAGGIFDRVTMPVIYDPVPPPAPTVLIGRQAETFTRFGGVFFADPLSESGLCVRWDPTVDSASYRVRFGSVEAQRVHGDASLACTTASHLTVAPSLLDDIVLDEGMNVTIDALDEAGNANSSVALIGFGDSTAPLVMVDFDLVRTPEGNTTVSLNVTAKALGAAPIVYIGITLGQTPGADNVASERPVHEVVDVDLSWDTAFALTQVSHLEDLALSRPGITYISARALTAARVERTVSSTPVVVDETPPRTGLVRDGQRLHFATDDNEPTPANLDIDFQADGTHLYAFWELFTEDESHVEEICALVSVKPDDDESIRTPLYDPVCVHSSATQVTIPGAFDTGVAYSTGIYAVNSYKVPSDVVWSDGVVIDTTAPVIIEGPAFGENGTATSQPWTDSIPVYIDGVDVESDIRTVHVGFSSLPEDVDVTMVEVGPFVPYVWYDTRDALLFAGAGVDQPDEFQDGQVYFARVCLENLANLMTCAWTPHGILIDTSMEAFRFFDVSKPFHGRAVNSDLGVDLPFSPTDELVVSWTPFTDPETGISDQEVCVTSWPVTETCDLLPWTSVGPFDLEWRARGLGLASGDRWYASVRSINPIGFLSEEIHTPVTRATDGLPALTAVISPGLGTRGGPLMCVQMDNSSHVSIELTVDGTEPSTGISHFEIVYQTKRLIVGDVGSYDWEPVTGLSSLRVDGNARDVAKYYDELFAINSTIDTTTMLPPSNVAKTLDFTWLAGGATGRVYRLKSTVVAGNGNREVAYTEPFLAVGTKRDIYNVVCGTGSTFVANSTDLFVSWGAVSTDDVFVHFDVEFYGIESGEQVSFGTVRVAPDARFASLHIGRTLHSVVYSGTVVGRSFCGLAIEMPCARDTTIDATPPVLESPPVVARKAAAGAAVTFTCQWEAADDETSGIEFYHVTVRQDDEVLVERSVSPTAARLIEVQSPLAAVPKTASVQCVVNACNGAGLCTELWSEDFRTRIDAAEARNVVSSLGGTVFLSSALDLATPDEWSSVSVAFPPGALASEETVILRRFTSPYPMYVENYTYTGLFFEATLSGLEESISVTFGDFVTITSTSEKSINTAMYRTDLFYWGETNHTNSTHDWILSSYGIEDIGPTRVHRHYVDHFTAFALFFTSLADDVYGNGDGDGDGDGNDDGNTNNDGSMNPQADSPASAVDGDVMPDNASQNDDSDGVALFATFFAVFFVLFCSAFAFRIRRVLQKRIIVVDDEFESESDGSESTLSLSDPSSSEWSESRSESRSESWS